MCLSVTKVIILYSKDLVVSHVYSYIPYSKELVVSMFPDTFRIQRIWSFLMFIDTFRNQKCLETVKRQNPLKYSKNLVKFPVSGHFPYSKVSRNSETTKSLEIMTFQEILLFLLFPDTFGKGWKIRRSEGQKVVRFK